MLTDHQVKCLKDLICQMATDAVDDNSAYDRGTKKACEVILSAIEAYKPVTDKQKPLEWWQHEIQREITYFKARQADSQKDAEKYASMGNGWYILGSAEGHATAFRTIVYSLEGLLERAKI